MPYRYLEDVATADAAFRAWGGGLEELFYAAAEAALRVMVENPEQIAQKFTRPLDLENDAPDLLLYEFLQEIVFYKDAESLLLRPEALQVVQEQSQYHLTGKWVGEPIDPERHELLMDIKSVTLHLLAVQQTACGWQGTVVLDL